jgi:hypothetical protein
VVYGFAKSGKKMVMITVHHRLHEEDGVFLRWEQYLHLAATVLGLGWFSASLALCMRW